MRSKIIDNLTSRFESYGELIDQVDDQALTERIDAPKHKSLAEHLWCVVGARESYAKALVAGEWVGFNCSMTKYERSDFESKLIDSASEVQAAIESIDDWTSQHDDLLATLAEHEVMHEGQIIRHVYGMGATLPSNWKWA